MAFENFPYTNFHEINLDWIVAKVKEAYSASNPPDYPVKSVNGMTGDVIIAIPANLVSSVNGETGDVVLYRNPLTQFPATNEQRWNLFRICDGDERGIEFDEDGAHRIEGTRRILIYDEENQPDYPVTSVNGQTGDVRISAGVNSVNGKSGNVVTPFVNPNADILTLDSNSNTVLWGISRNVAGGNVALYITTGGTNPQAFIRYTPTDGEAINLPLLTNADIPASAGVVSVNGKTGVVTLYGNDILLSDSSAENVTDTLLNNVNKTNGIYDTIFTDKPGTYLAWKNGYYRPHTGIQDTSNNNYIVTNILTPKQYSKITSVRTENDLKVTILGWSNEGFVGLYNKSTHTFEITQSSEAYFETDIDILEIRTKFPNYSIAFEARAFPIRHLPATEAVNIIFTVFDISSDTDITEITNVLTRHTQQISALQSNDATQNQQISALQTEDTTINQQITALQNADTTHDQQISALQASDTAQNQQIAELQSTDATHSQQITDLYNASVTQGNQINDLYTRTGIYGIFIENVNSLPLRYPATGTDAKIKSTNMVVSMDLYVSGVQVDAWTITTYDGYLEITGTMNGTSSMTLYLA